MRIESRRDKQREKQRQQNLEVKAKKETEQAPRPTAKAVAEPVKKLPSEKRRKISAREELDELENDYALYRKLKKKKISEEDFFDGLEGGDD